MKSPAYTVMTADTPNGVKVPIALEELGLSYAIRRIDLSAGEQRSENFLKLNPNGKIPVLHWIDEAGHHQALSESGAILLYLAHSHGALLGDNSASIRRTLEWLFYQVSAIGPVFGNAGWFRRNDPTNNVAIGRFSAEAERLVALLDQALGAVDWLNGSSISIADIAHFGWIQSASYAGLDLSHYPNLKRWLSTMNRRPAVANALKRLSEKD